MPAVKLSVGLSFQEGQKTVYSVETLGVSPGSQQDEQVTPYRLSDATGPDEPTLISSTSFVKVG